MKTKQDVVDWLEENQALFTNLSDEIWANPELAFQEFKASKLQAVFLEEEGFSVDWDAAGISTAFIAEWGEGKPVIGFAGEYDALPGLSQKVQPTQDPIEPGAPGQGCGHNLLGVGCLAGAVGVKRWLEETGTPGTVRYYGCPAEEAGSGKTFMAAAGLFDDLDAAFNFHPGIITYAMKGSSLGVNEVRFRFHGRTAHAGGAPHLGRSALDAVELTNIGVNYLREHVEDDVRIHYVISDGGQAPNIVPETAEVWYFIRAHLPPEVEEVTERVRKIAQGAALMTETRLEEIWDAGLSSVLSNHTLADMQTDSMRSIDPIEYTDEERDFAMEMNSNFPSGIKESNAKELKLPLETFDASILEGYYENVDVGVVRGGSTDVGDLSWLVPVSMLRVTCAPSAIAWHSWGVSASAGMSIGHKGMMYAAKVMAITAIELYKNREKLAAVRREFEASTANNKYTSPIREGVKPPQYEHPYR